MCWSLGLSPETSSSDFDRSSVQLRDLLEHSLPLFQQPLSRGLLICQVHRLQSLSAQKRFVYQCHESSLVNAIEAYHLVAARVPLDHPNVTTIEGEPSSQRLHQFGVGTIILRRRGYRHLEPITVNPRSRCEERKESTRTPTRNLLPSLEYTRRGIDSMCTSILLPSEVTRCRYVAAYFGKRVIRVFVSPSEVHRHCYSSRCGAPPEQASPAAAEGLRRAAARPLYRLVARETTGNC